MVINESHGVVRASLDDGAIEDRSEVVIGSLPTRVMEVVMEGNVKERRL